jgi:3,4-dihydroxy 2-butanone 4-phosphate synthase/GTP cyclohydrolase II
MHAGSTVADVFASTPREGGRHLRQAITRIEAAGTGVIVYLPAQGDLAGELANLTNTVGDPHAAPKDGPADNPLREFGLGAQVLSDLGVRKLRLLTNNPRKIAGLAGYGLEVVESVPLIAEPQ